MTDSIVQQFAGHLSSIEDISERDQLMRRVRLLAMNQAPDEAFEPPIIKLGDYLDTPIEVPPSIVWPTIVVRGELTATLGRAGKGKTTMNLNRLLKWAAGRPYFDTLTAPGGVPYMLPGKPLKVLIIENEGSAGMFHHKMGIMLSEGQLSTEDRGLIRENVHIWGDGGYSGLKLDDVAQLNQVRAGCEKVEPDVVFIEPFRSLWKGEENSSTEMANMVDALVALATDFECGVMISHHERKSGAGEDGELMSAGRGSTVLEGVVAIMENFQSVVGGDFREITWSKARYLEPPPVTRLEYDVQSTWYRHVPMDELETSIVSLLGDGEAWSAKEVADQLGERYEKVKGVLDGLSKNETLKKQKVAGANEMKYRLPSGSVDNGGLDL